ncbi:MAG TPA: alpha/beta hydrolase [Pseudorhodoplanes sp.]|nr:alpha/beta hydrolase [Pseudorhodoplanes sp.]
MTQINVQFVYGAGNDMLFGGGLRDLQSAVKAKFGTKVYSPRIIDYTEYETLLRLLRQWNDPTILVGHSCGCNAVTHAAVALSMERVPYLLAIAPSIYCPVAALPPNVGRATQATSNPFDFFNPFGRTLLRTSSVNNKTKLDVINTGLPHLTAPYHAAVKKRLLEEIDVALTA